MKSQNVSTQFEQKMRAYVSQCESALEGIRKANGVSLESPALDRRHHKAMAAIHLLLASAMYRYPPYRGNVEAKVLQNVSAGIQFDGKNYQLYALLGRIRQKSKLYCEAIVAYQQALEFCDDAKK